MFRQTGCEICLKCLASFWESAVYVPSNRDIANVEKEILFFFCAYLFEFEKREEIGFCEVEVEEVVHLTTRSGRCECCESKKKGKTFRTERIEGRQ